MSEDNIVDLEKILEEFLHSKTGRMVKLIDTKLINELRELVDLLKNREPRIMMIGRRGVGKSSLINALFGEKVASIGAVVAETPKAEWKTFSSEGKNIKILDTRGTGEGDPVKEGVAKNPLKDIQSQIKEVQPDLVVYVCKAKDVDANVEHDITFLSNVISYLRKNYKQDNIEIVVVVNQVDELDPKRVLPPFDNEDKMNNILTATNHTKAMIEKYAKKHVGVIGVPDEICTIPVCSYLEFDKETNEINYDERWQIDILFERIVDKLPNSAKLQAMKLQNVKELQRQLANKIVLTFSTITAGVGSQPIPIADMPVISSLQASMIMMIAKISGRKIELSSLKEILASMGIQIGSAFAFREGARALLKLIPGYGNVISATIAGGATKIYGNIAIEYFINGKDANYLKNLLDKEMTELKEEK